MSEPLRVLLVEDRDDDAELLLRELSRIKRQIVHKRVETSGEMRQALSEREWDLVISDYSLPKFNGIQALAILQEIGIDLPFIVVSGTIDEEMAVAALKAGAHDFISKTRLARFLPAVERELREAVTRRARRKAEAALRESESKYRKIVETAQEGIWMIDEKGRTTYANSRMAELLKTTDDDVLARPILDFVDSDWRETVLENLERRRQGIAEQHELCFRRADGSEFWASVSANPLFDENGQFSGALAMVTDLTESKRLQEQLMVSDRMVSVGMLAAGVAHEINNPLTVILGRTELALRDLDNLGSNPDVRSNIVNVREQMHEVRDAAQRVQNIVRDLRVFSRSEEDKRSLVEVRRVMESSLRMAWTEIRRRARLVKDYEDVPLVEANESRLGQVFLNLVVNAAQAIPEGRADSNEIRIATRRDSTGLVVVEVRDSGSGMPPEVVRRLFTPFFTTKPIGVGTGLGLSICHRIVTALGGEIRVETEVGRGTAFQVVLPAAVGKIAEDSRAEKKAQVCKKHGKVLIVDDEPAIVDLLQSLLAHDHEVAVATESKDALQRIRNGEFFDVILCDLMMPQITGMELHSEVRRMNPHQADRIIFLTGGAFTPRARAFLDEVQNLRVEKPFDLVALHALVNDRIR